MIKLFTNCEKISGQVNLSKRLLEGDIKEYLLLESADIVTKLGEKSLLFFDYALKLECRNNKVVVSLVSDRGALLFSEIKAYFENCKQISTTQIEISYAASHQEIDLFKKISSPSPLDTLRKVMSLLDVLPKNKPYVSLAGGFSYDFLDQFEHLPPPKKDLLECPDFLFYFPLSCIEVDHKKKETKVVVHSFNNEHALSTKKATFLKSFVTQNCISDKKRLLEKEQKISEFSYGVDISDKEFQSIVKECKQFVQQGEVYQIVPSRTFSCPIKDSLKAYETLKSLNPSPYMFFMKTPFFELFGSSPETFIKVQGKTKKVSITPIAGTVVRGIDSNRNIDWDLDARLEASLSLNEKELAEHMMLVDLARNDIAFVCEPGSRKVEKLLGVDKFSHVMHLVSKVSGRLKNQFDSLTAYQAAMNMGTLVGAPKIRAASLLRKIEKSKRGFYGGAIGYLNKKGDFDTAIIIRSAFVTGKKAYVRAGCGVVNDSDALLETHETTNKAKAVLRAIEIASNL